MDDAEDEVRYPSSMDQEQVYDSSNTKKLPVRAPPFARSVNNQYVDDDDEEEDDDEDEAMGDEVDDKDQMNGMTQPGKIVGGGEDDDDEEEDDDEDEDDFYDDDDDDDEQHKNHGRKTNESERRVKKRKLKSLISSYEFAPRVPPPPNVASSAPLKPPSTGGRNSLMDWTEPETFVLLDAWGDRFLQRGRKSLRSDEWQEVAEKVSEVSKVDRTESQCRNRLDTLKKKYKKEKTKMAETGVFSSKWVYFKKMDMLMTSPSQQTGLSCGVDSGEYVFMNPRVYLNRANGMDEMRDSPGNSESYEKEGEDSDGLPPKKRKSGRESSDGTSFKLLADTVTKFSKIYEKIENNKRQQMMELEKMRMDFQRELELQRKQIMEKAQAEIAKIRQGDDVENDLSAENASG